LRHVPAGDRRSLRGAGWVNRHDLRWTAQPPTFRRSSPIAERGFCAECGTPLLLSYDGRGDIALMIGSLDDAAPWAPASHYGVEGRLPWADCGKDLPEANTKQRF
jgi:hypothetical protein